MALTDYSKLAAVSAAIWLVVVGVCDLQARRIPNWILILGIFALAILYFLGEGLLPWGVFLWLGILGSLLGFFGLIFFYVLGWMGAADVKLATVLGLGAGWEILIAAWAVASFFAAIHSLMIIFSRNTVFWPWAQKLLQGKLEKSASGKMQKPIPYGTYLVAGVFIARHHLST